MSLQFLQDLADEVKASHEHTWAVELITDYVMSRREKELFELTHPHYGTYPVSMMVSIIRDIKRYISLMDQLSRALERGSSRVDKIIVEDLRQKVHNQLVFINGKIKALEEQSGNP